MARVKTLGLFEVYAREAYSLDPRRIIYDVKKFFLFIFWGVRFTLPYFEKVQGRVDLTPLLFCFLRYLVRSDDHIHSFKGGVCIRCSSDGCLFLLVLCVSGFLKKRERNIFMHFFFVMIRQKFLLQNSHLVVFILQTRGVKIFKMKLSAS